MCLGATFVACCESCSCVFVRGYRNIFLRINFHIHYILHCYYNNFKTTYYLLLVLCLAYHLMCWPDTSDDRFKPVEKPSGSFPSWSKIFSGSFQVWRKISLDLLLHIACVAHIEAFVFNKGPCYYLFAYVLFHYFYLRLMTSYLRRWLSQAIYLAINWPYLADSAAMYVIQPHDGP